MGDNDHDLPRVIDRQQRDDSQNNDHCVRISQQVWSRDNMNNNNNNADFRPDTSSGCLHRMDITDDRDNNRDSWRNGDDNRDNLRSGDDNRDILEQLHRRFEHCPSDKERARAEEELNSHLSPLIPDADRKNLEAINHAILNGDGAAVAAALKNVPPDKLDAYLQELDNNLRETHAGVTLAKTEDGKVVMYRDHGQRALEMDPTKGEVVSVHAINVLPNGDVELGGEILNGDTEKLAKRIGDSAVDNINGPEFIGRRPPIEWPPHPWPEWPPRRDWELPRDFYPPFDRDPRMAGQYWGAIQNLLNRYADGPSYQPISADQGAIDFSQSPYVQYAGDQNASTPWGTSI